MKAIRLLWPAVLFCAGLLVSAAEVSGARNQDGQPEASGKKLEQATFGTGCFWCTEAIFESLAGVESAVSGYSGGTKETANYFTVSTGLTGHAEVVHLQYDPAMISYEQLLEVFWATHDPTTPNRQGKDIGPQYRSVIFYHSQSQRKAAENYKTRLADSREFKRPVVTQIAPFQGFYRAENYHQDYYAHHRREPYCQDQIRPKLRKFKRQFRDMLETRNGKSKPKAEAAVAVSKDSD